MKAGFLEGKRVLDLASNSGYWSLVPATDGKAAFVQGVETVPELVEQANFVFDKYAVPKDRYHFAHAGAYQFLEQTKDQFDVILCLGFFYHIDEPMRLMRLMAARCKGLTIIDTVIHNSEEALVSCRPVQPTRGLEGTRTTLEFVSSPKAIHWMAREAGFASARTLKGTFSENPALWDYRKGERTCFVASNGPDIGALYENAVDPGYLTPQEDLAKFGYFPEMRKGRQEPAAPAAKQMFGL